MEKTFKIPKPIDLEALYPNHSRKIHKVPCKNCPSTHTPIPEEEIWDQEIKKLPKDIIAKEHLFICGWRPSQLCKGFCDKMEIDQKQLDEIYF